MSKILPQSLILLNCLLGNVVFAQSLPATDIWLVKIDAGLHSEPQKVNTTSGYNNQPHFSDDGSSIYYTREMVSDEGNSQTDVAVFQISAATTNMANHTAESEYSPTPMPDRNAVSVIQADLNQKQFLTAIDLASGKTELLLPHVEPVGYHAWVNDNEVAMFILGDSFTLQIASLKNDDVDLVAENIGRSIRKHPDTGEILFVDKNREPWQIAAYDHKTKALRGVVPLFPGNEDFTIDVNGDYWTGNGSKLYRRSAGEQRWELVTDFKFYGLNNISRLAIHLATKQIAIVSDHH